MSRNILWSLQYTLRQNDIFCPMIQLFVYFWSKTVVSLMFQQIQFYFNFLCIGSNTIVEYRVLKSCSRYSNIQFLREQKEDNILQRRLKSKTEKNKDIF